MYFRLGRIMDADDISKLIREQIAEVGSPSNPHGVDLNQCLVTPTPIQVIARSVLNGKTEDTIERVWLVLVERPPENYGYRIVFSEQHAAFGLASPGFPGDKHPVLCGLVWRLSSHPGEHVAGRRRHLRLAANSVRNA